MKGKILRALLICIIIFMNIGCDQSTKFIAKNYLKDTGVVRVIDDYFVLHYVENSGGFLSLFSTFPIIFRIIMLSILPSIMLVLMTYYMMINKNVSRTYMFAFCCIIGGGISNIFDRFKYGNVIDFMNFGIGNIRTGILNFADLSITLGFFILLFLTIRRKYDMKKINVLR